jgi:predicted Zn-dependent protease
MSSRPFPSSHGRSWTSVVAALAFCLLAPSRVRAGETGAAAPATAAGGIEALPAEERIALSARWDLGYYLFQLQDYAGAAREFEKIRQVLPGEATLLALIGSCYSMTGRTRDGERNLLMAREQAPADADVNGLLGQFYLSIGKGLKGAFYLEHALKAAPELADLRVSLADVYLAAGRPGKARAHLEALLGERGGAEFGEARLDHAYARSLVQTGRFREALPFALRAYRAQSRNPAFARTLGLCLMGTNRYGEAARMLSESRGVPDGNDAELHLHLGEALFQDRRWQAAEETWLAGITRFPSSYALLSRLVDYYVGAARPGLARRVVAYAGDQNPGHPGNLLLAARLDRKLGEYAAARKSLARLKRQASGALGLEALWEEAQLDYETGRYAACGRILDKLLTGRKGGGEGVSRSGEAFLLKARLALQRRDLPAAQAAVLEAKAANPYNLKVYSLARAAFSRPEDRGALRRLMQDARDLMPDSRAMAARGADAR